MNERVKQLLVLGREHYSKREFEKAEQMLRMVLEEEDRYADVHDMLGVIAHSRGNFLVAERHFERTTQLPFVAIFYFEQSEEPKIGLARRRAVGMGVIPI